MPKAILELEKMPSACYGGGCPFYKIPGICDILSSFNHHMPVYVPSKGRRDDCPLKLADEHCRKAEWVNGKCRGFQVSRWNYDAIPKCKNCKDFEEYKEAE